MGIHEIKQQLSVKSDENKPATKQIEELDKSLLKDVSGGGGGHSKISFDKSY